MTHQQYEGDEALDAAIRSCVSDIVAATDASARMRSSTEWTMSDSEPGMVDARRGSAFLAVALVLLVAGVAGLWLTRGGRAEPLVKSVDSALPLPKATAPVLTTDEHQRGSSTLAAAPEQSIHWSTARVVGSIARSTVEAVVAGPSGFVATGFGTDDGRNQGRVWFSADGEVWSEPAFEVFETLRVSDPISTRDAYFVLASTNLDRLPDGPSDPSLVAESNIYRSIDGETWTKWGDAQDRLLSIAPAGKSVIRQTFEGSIEWSQDGVQWTRSSFDPIGGDAAVPALVAKVIEIGPEVYLWGSADGLVTVWRSVDDGISWAEVASPPGGGLVWNNGGTLTVVEHAGPGACADGQLAPTTNLDSLDSVWACTSQSSMYEFDSSHNIWSAVQSSPAPSSPAAAPVARVGDFLVSPILASDRSLSVWELRPPGSLWRQVESIRLDFSGQVGSPGVAPIAVLNDRVLVVSPHPIQSANTSILIGQLTRA